MYTGNPVPGPLPLWETPRTVPGADHAVNCHCPFRSAGISGDCLCSQEVTLAKALPQGRSEEPQQLLVDHNHISFPLSLSFLNKLLHGFVELYVLLLMVEEQQPPPPLLCCQHCILRVSPGKPDSSLTLKKAFYVTTQ